MEMKLNKQLKVQDTTFQLLKSNKLYQEYFNRKKSPAMIDRGPQTTLKQI